MKSKTTAYLLWFFLGIVSAHRFYLGKYGSAILYLLTLQLAGIGWIVDLFLLGGMVEQKNTKKELKTIRKATSEIIKDNKK
ncbi:MAG: TM2 domain-containing protein [Chlorobi bacterium]|nr:TM2 domain-containing protein [Chlorobiota bacterium]